MQNALLIIYALAALASGFAAVLAWVAKIRWAAEYKEAKEAQIQQWKDMASTNLLAQFLAAQKMWEGIAEIKDRRIADLEAQVESMQAQMPEAAAREALEAYRDQAIFALRVQTEYLREQAEARTEAIKTQLEDLRRSSPSASPSASVSPSASPSPSTSPSASVSPSE